MARKGLAKLGKSTTSPGDTEATSPQGLGTGPPLQGPPRPTARASRGAARTKAQEDVRRQEATTGGGDRAPVI